MPLRFPAFLHSLFLVKPLSQWDILSSLLVDPGEPGGAAEGHTFLLLVKQETRRLEQDESSLFMLRPWMALSVPDF